MNKWISLSLSVIMVFLLTACGSAPMRDPGVFYYKRIDTDYGSTDSVIAPETRELSGIRDDIGELLNSYFQGPNDDTLESPFPRNTTVVKCVTVDNTLLLTLSQEFGELSGVDLTIACGCLTRTIIELTSIQRINFQVEDGLLNGSPSISMSKKNLQLVDDSLERLVTNITVYYSDANRRYLVGKDIAINLANEVDVIDCLINQLSNPPKDSELLSPLPDGTKLLDSTIENKVCKINFSSEFDSKVWRNAEAQRLTLMCVVNTLTQLDQIDHVEFYSEGNLLTQYRSLHIPGPMSWDERAIGPVRTGLNEFDASLYLVNGSDDYLVCVPTRIRQTAGISKAEMILQELITYKAANGFASPIPPDTKINSVCEVNGICQIDLSSEFIAVPARVPQAIHSIIASITSLEDINEVVITVDGSVPSGELAPYFEYKALDPGWIL